MDELGLICPVCGLPLAGAGPSARCERGHFFDFARSGYLNLSGGRGSGRVGDTPAMVRAREELLASGHYEPIATALARLGSQGAADFSSAERDKSRPRVVEVGCGTGYYLAAVAAASGATQAFGFDLSRAAIDRAAKTHRCFRFAVADVEAGIPLADGSVEVAISAFAPRPAAELARVVRPGGALLVAYATPRHLRALRARLDLLDVGADKLERLRERLTPGFELDATELVELEASFSAAEATALVAMGPNARHRAPDAEPPGAASDLVSVEVARFARR